jgi:hypothetical protein
MSNDWIWSENTTQARLARWEALWALEDLPRPIWYVPADPILSLTNEYAKQQKPIKNLIIDKEVQLAESLRWNRFFEKLQRFFYQDDFIPRLQPQLGIGVVASAFGAEVTFPEDQLPMTHPVIKPGEPASRVYELDPPAANTGQLGDVLEYTAYFNKNAGRQYPIALTDLQGPLDTAYLIWNTNDFMIAMLEHPKEVHYLMRMVTDLIIKFVKEMRSRADWFVPAHFPPAHLPDGKGITISEDVLALLSPRMYEQFSLPYLNELSEEFGGIVIHSCGNIEHQLGVLEKVHNLRGINFGITETHFEALWERFGGKVVLLPHCSSTSLVANFSTAYDWVAHVLKVKTHNRGLALMVAPQVSDIHAGELKTALREKSSLFDDLVQVLLFGSRIRRMLARSS